MQTARESRDITIAMESVYDMLVSLNLPEVDITKEDKDNNENLKSCGIRGQIIIHPTKSKDNWGNIHIRTSGRKNGNRRDFPALEIRGNYRTNVWARYFLVKEDGKVNLNRIKEIIITGVAHEELFSIKESVRGLAEEANDIIEEEILKEISKVTKCKLNDGFKQGYGDGIVIDNTLTLSIQGVTPLARGSLFQDIKLYINGNLNMNECVSVIALLKKMRSKRE